MYKTERLELRLTAREVQLLDQVRGPATRSAWIRNQILRATQHGCDACGRNRPCGGPHDCAQMGIL